MEDHHYWGLVLREATPSDRERCGTSTEENLRRFLPAFERKRGETKRTTNSGIPIGGLSWRHSLTVWGATPAAPIEGMSRFQKWTNRRATPGVPIEGLSLLQKCTNRRTTPGVPMKGLSRRWKWTNRRTTSGVPMKGLSRRWKRTNRRKTPGALTEGLSRRQKWATPLLSAVAVGRAGEDRSTVSGVLGWGNGGTMGDGLKIVGLVLAWNFRACEHQAQTRAHNLEMLCSRAVEVQSTPLRHLKYLGDMRPMRHRKHGPFFPISAKQHPHKCVVQFSYSTHGFRSLTIPFSRLCFRPKRSLKHNLM